MQTVASQLKASRLARTECFGQKFRPNGGYTCCKVEIPYRTLLLLTLLIELSPSRAKLIAELMRWEALTTSHARMIECLQIILETYDRIDVHKTNFSLFQSDNHITLDCRYDVKHQGIQRAELDFSNHTSTIQNLG